MRSRQLRGIIGAGVWLGTLLALASSPAVAGTPSFVSAKLRVAGEQQRKEPHYLHQADCGSFDCALATFGRKEPRFDRVSRVRPGDFTARLFIPVRMRPTRLAILAWRDVRADGSPRGERRLLDYVLRPWERRGGGRGWKARFDLPLPPDRYLDARAGWRDRGQGSLHVTQLRWSFGFVTEE